MPVPGDPDWVLPRYTAPKAPEDFSRRGLLGAGFSSGINDVQALLGSAAQGAGRLFGLTPLERYGRDVSERNMAESTAAGRPDLETAPWREDGAPALKWLGYQAAKQVPIIGTYMLGGRVYRGLGGSAPQVVEQAATAVPRALGGGGVLPGANFAVRRAAVQGGARQRSKQLAESFTGGSIAGLPIAFGAMVQEADQKPGGLTVQDATKAAILSPVYSALDALQPAALGSLFKYGQAGGIARRVAAAGLAGAAAEVPQEGLQTALEQSFRDDLPLSERMANIVDAAVTGGAVGGVFGGFGGIRRMKRADPTTVTEEDMVSAVDEILGLPPPQAGRGTAAPNAVIAGDQVIPPTMDVTTGERTDVQSFKASEPASRQRPFENVPVEQLQAGLGAARKAIESGNASDEVKRFVEAAHSELQARNIPSTNSEVDGVPAEAVQRELNQRRGTAEQISDAPVSAKNPIESRISELTKGLRLPATLKERLASARSEDEIQSIVHDEVIVQDKGGKMRTILAQRAGVLDDDGRPTQLASTLETRAPRRTRGATPVDATFQAQWKADVQRVGQRDKVVRALSPESVEDAQTKLYQALGTYDPNKHSDRDGIERLAQKYGVLDENLQLTPLALDIAKNDPIPPKEAREAAVAQGFKANSMFERGVSAHLGGEPVTKFKSKDDWAAYTAGARWAEERNSIPKVTSNYWTSGVMRSQKGGANATVGTGITVPPEQQAQQIANRAIDSANLSPATQEDDVAQLKRMVREGNVVGAMQGLELVQRGESLFQQPGRKASTYRGESVVRGAPRGQVGSVTLVPTKAVTRAEAERAIRKYELSRSIDAAFAEGAIDGKERVRLVGKLRQGKIRDVVAALPEGIAPVMSQPKMSRAARLALKKKRGDLVARIQQLWEETAPEGSEEVQELTVNEIGQIRDTIRSKPGVNAKRMAKMLGPQLYGDPTDMGDVSIKEILQNSYDAIKGLQRAGTLGKGRIDIVTDNGGRTIRVVDNGAGMSPELLGGRFLEIAGTGKETEAASGGFGIAKMLFLYGNKELEVITMRDGVVSRLRTSGEELFDALENPDNAPMIETSQATAEDMELFPDGHGTVIEVTIPETFDDPMSGKAKRINPVRSAESVEALKYSPLFADIDVTFHRRARWSEELKLLEGIGSTFRAEDYTQFANVKFAWGSARVYISRGQNGQTWGKNVHILSNGLWQFSQTMKKNPGDVFGPNLPYTIYVDINPTVRPEDAGYPFTFNRQQFTEQASSEWHKIAKYINALYGYHSMAESAISFGGLRYFNNDGTLTEPIDLKPEVPVANTAFAGIQEGDTVTVVDGRLLVDGRELPELTTEQLQQGIPKPDSLMVNPDLIDPGKIAVHDNVLVGSQVPVDSYSGQTDEVYDSYSDHMRDQFGRRWDEYMFLVGSTMKRLRDEVAKVMGYDELKAEAVGVSIDREYYGVSIRLPFNGSFINPATTEAEDPSLAPYAMLQTMIHEFAHHRERNHGVDFIKEMQRIQAALKRAAASGGFQFTQFEDRFAELFQQYADVYNHSRGIFSNERHRLKSSGSRFDDGDTEQIPAEGGRGEATGPAGVGPAGVADEPLYDRIGGGSGPGEGGPPTGRDRQGAAPFGPLSALAANDTAQKVVRNITSRVPIESATAATRKIVFGWNSIGHLVSHYAKQFPQLILYAKAHLERRATQARWAQLFETPYQAYEKLERDDPKVAETIRFLLSRTFFEIDPTKPWDQHQHLHGAPNEARLKELTDEANRKYNVLRGKGQAQVYDDFRAINEATHIAMMSVSLHNLVVSDPALKENITGFDVDPTDAFRERPALHESPQNSRRYWSDMLDEQVKNAEEFIQQLRGDTTGSAAEQKVASMRLEPIEMRIRSIRESLAAMRNAPYFHLGRHGEHFVAFTLRLNEAKQVDPAAIEQAGKTIQEAGFRDIEISRDATNPKVYIRVESIEARNRLEQVVQQLQKGGWLKPDSEIKAAPRASASDTGTADQAPAWLERYIELLQASPMFEPTDNMTDGEKATLSAKKAQMVSHARELWLDMLPDTAIAKVMVHRNFVPGFDKDMIRSFAFRFQVGVNSLSNLSASAKLTDAFTQMRAAVFDAQLTDSPQHQNVDLLQSLLSEVLVREANRPVQEHNDWIDMWRAINHAYFLGFSPSYVAVNTTQIGVLLWPELAKKHGFAKSARAIASVTSTAFSIMRETLKAGARVGPKRALDAVITEDVLRKAGVGEDEAGFLMKIISDGIIDIGGSSRELSRIAESRGTGSTRENIDVGLRWAASFGLYSETFTRLIAALSARKLAGNDLDYARRTVEQSMLNYSNWNTARQMGRMGIAGRFTPVMMSFLQYTAQVLEKLYREFHTAITRGGSAQEKAEARRFIAGHLVAVTTLAGTLGLPFATVGAMVIEKMVDLLDDDEEPFDATAAWRNFMAGIFGKEIGEIVSRGAPRAAGFDLSQRAGEQNMIPFTQFLTDKREWREAATEVSLRSLGAPVSMIVSIAEGGSKISEGDVIGGMTTMLPLAFKGPAKSYQMTEDGYVDMQGNKLPMTPSQSAILVQLLGFSPAEKAEYSEARGDQAARESVLQAKAKRLRKGLEDALVSGDDAELDRLLTEAQAFDLSNPSFAVIPDIRRSLRRRARVQAIAAATEAPIGVTPDDVSGRALTDYANIEYRAQ